MNVSDVKKIAKGMGIKISGLKKADLIRAIQVAEGNIPCFKTGMQHCDQTNCFWKEDCLP